MKKFNEVISGMLEGKAKEGIFDINISDLLEFQEAASSSLILSNMQLLIQGLIDAHKDNEELTQVLNALINMIDDIVNSSSQAFDGWFEEKFETKETIETLHDKGISIKLNPEELKITLTKTEKESK